MVAKSEATGGVIREPTSVCYRGPMRVLIFCLALAAVLCAAGVAGKYKGSYSGAAGESGEIQVTLKQSDDGAWKSEVTFTYDGENIKTKVKSVTVDGAKVKIVYEFDLEDNGLESTLAGELSGATLAGDYKTKAGEDGSSVSEGTWNAVAQ
jgi:hypothetical protein